MSDSEIPEIKTKQSVSLCGGGMSDSEIPETKTKQPVFLCGVMSDTKYHTTCACAYVGKNIKISTLCVPKFV